MKQQPFDSKEIYVNIQHDQDVDELLKDLKQSFSEFKQENPSFAFTQKDVPGVLFELLNLEPIEHIKSTVRHISSISYNQLTDPDYLIIKICDRSL